MSIDLRRVLAASDTLADLPAEAARILASALHARTLDAGTTLFEAGDRPDGMAVVDRGRLGVVDSAGEVVATLGRGQVVGEMGALTGAARTSTVIAMRDTAVLEIDQPTFDQVFDSSPIFGRALSRLVVSRLTDPDRADRPRAVPTTVAVVEIGAGDTGDLLKSLDAQVGAAAVVGPEIAAGRSEPEIMAALENLESDNDLLLLLAGRLERSGEWFDRCLRQADAVIVHVADPHGAIPEPMAEFAARLHRLHITVELVVSNPAHAEVGTDASAWTAALRPDRLHHLRRGDPETVGRCARLVLGRGIGLVFSGGAAKGLAHLGVWRALCELGVKIDAVAGVSFGALLGAGVALDYPPADLQDEVEARLVNERGLVDLTFPWMALLRGKGVSERLEEVARGRSFEQTWRSYVCTACDLTSGEVVELRTGPLWRAVRASVSIPGLLPPVRIGDHLLVDGAVRDNLPVAALLAGHPTPLRIIAVDVGKDSVLAPGDMPSASDISGWQLVARRLNPRRESPGVPSMAQVLMRVMELAGQDSGIVPDTVIRPDLRALGLSDFEQIDQYAQAGYTATIEALGDTV